MTTNRREYIIDAKSWKLKLKNVDYSFTEIDEDHLVKMIEGSIGVRLNTKDHYDILDVDQDFVELHFQRELFYEPEMAFAIKIDMGVLFEINDEYNGEISLLKIKQEVADRRDELLMPVASKASLIISNLTNVNSGSVPVVTPPYFNEE